jgi:hypothetical protein
MRRKPKERYYREPVSSALKRLVRPQKKRTITMDELAEALKDRGIAFLLMVLVIPTMAPIAPPGFSMTLSIPQFFLAFQMAFGFKRLWLPGWIGRRELKVSSLRFVIHKALPLILWLERRLKPRVLNMSSRAGEQMIGWISVICCMSVLAPIPFSNSVPSLGMTLMTLGLLERDGVVIMAGIWVAWLGLGITTSMIFLGTEAVTASLHFLHW